MWSTALLRKQEKSYRIAPVAEVFMHVGDAKKLYRAVVRLRTYPRVFRTCAGLLRSQYRPTSEGHRPEGSGSKRTGCSLACARRKPAVTSEMVARSRRQRVAKGNGRTVPPDGVERTAIQIQITVDNPGGRHSYLGITSE